MKQLLQNLRSGETAVVDVPIPSPRPGTALVRTAASLVSAGTERTLVEFAEKSLVGKARSRPDLVRQVIDKARREGLATTLEAAFNRLDQPMPLGYSSAGVIVQVEENARGFRVGQRVACAGGNFAVHAEYAMVPFNLLAPLPEHVDFEEAAFTTLGAIAMHGFRLAEIQVGSRVAVIGLGLLGLLATSIARAAGCRVFGVDIDPQRVELGKQFGAEAVLRPQAEQAAQVFTQGLGCDAVLICADAASSDPVELAGSIARDRARVVAVGAVGLNIPRKVYFEKELSFVNSRSYGPGRYDSGYEIQGQDYPIGYVRWTEGRNLESFVDLLGQGLVQVKPLISHRFPIERAPEAYTLITGKANQPFLGVLLTYAQPPASHGNGSDPAEFTLVRETIKIPHAKTGKPAEGALRLGVLGAGNFATAVLLPSVRKVAGIEPTGIASATGATAHHAAKKFGFKYASGSEQQILQDPEINTLAILTRHNQHAGQVLAGLKAGKHVFCEKPLAINPGQLAEIQDYLQDNHSKSPLLMVGFNRRFAPFARQLAAFFEQRSEPLAIHYRVNAGYIPLNHWIHDPETGGGRIIGEGCHFVDLLTYLVGSAPIWATAEGLPNLGRYHEDNVLLTFGFADGSLGSISYLANGDKAFPKERIEVFAAGQAAVLDDFRSLELVSGGRRQVFRSRLRQEKGHLHEWQAFAAAIQAGGPPPIPYEQLIGVTQATFAAVQALRSREKVQI